MRAKERAYWQAYVRDRVKIDPVTGCWEWQLCRNKRNYGCTYARKFGFDALAHRLSYTAFKGPIPQRKHLRHQCHNPPCCNPDHLRIGTAQDNADDTRRDGRMHGCQRLSVMQVLEIKCLLERKQHTQVQIGAMFGVTKYAIWRIAHGKIWTHV